MKNFKNTVAAMTMMVVMGFGATIANAGMLVTDRSTTPQTCSNTKADDPTSIIGILVSDLAGIIIAGRGDGIIIAGRDGIIIAGRGSEEATTCKN